jgi:hypothetical protein
MDKCKKEEFGYSEMYVPAARAIDAKITTVMPEARARMAKSKTSTAAKPALETAI